MGKLRGGKLLAPTAYLTYGRGSQLRSGHRHTQRARAALQLAETILTSGCTTWRVFIYSLSFSFGLDISLLSKSELIRGPLAHVTRADLCRKSRRVEADRALYRGALELVRWEIGARYLQNRLARL